MHRRRQWLPLQYSRLENPMDGGAWWAVVRGVAKTWTRLSNFTFTFHFPALEKETSTHSKCSCLENPRDGGAWWAAVYAVTQSRTWLKWLSSCSSSWLTCFRNFLILKQYSAVSPKVPSKKNSENSKRLCVHTLSIAKVLKVRWGNLRNVVSCFTNDVQNIPLKGGMGVCLRETSNISGQSGKYYLLSMALRTDFLRQYLNPGKATFFSVTIKYYMSASD